MNLKNLEKCDILKNVCKLSTRIKISSVLVCFFKSARPVYNYLLLNLIKNRLETIFLLLHLNKKTVD